MLSVQVSWHSVVLVHLPACGKLKVKTFNGYTRKITMAVTIKDIAKLANVSHTTVSRAMNNSPLIKDETKKKIMKIAQQLNYTPNYNAKSLVLQKSHSIGLFFSSMTSGTSANFFVDTIRGVNRVIDIEYNLFVRGIDDYTDFSSIHNKRFDGIILMSQSEADNPFVYHVLGQKIPLIVLNRQVSANGIVNILSDDKEGTYKVVQHFIDNGHRRIAIIEGIKRFKSTEQRREGFLNALIDHGVPIHQEYIVRGQYDMESGYQAMQELIRLEEPPTAVFCSNDDMAIGAMNAAFEHGLQIPEDISIAGFDDIGFSSYAIPSLTTVKRPIEQISALGAQKVLERINKPSTVEERIFLNTELIIRKSTAVKA